MILLDPDLEPGSPAPTRVRRRPSNSAQAIAARSTRIPNARTLSLFLRGAQAAIKLRGQVTVLLTTDGGIRRLNRQFRGKNKATDVLSFPAVAVGPLQVAGDLAISIPTARRQAEERGHSLGVEIKVLMLHGLLHLAGYDHETDEGQMARREQKLRAGLQLPHGLIERANQVERAVQVGGGRNGKAAKGPRR